MHVVYHAAQGNMVAGCLTLPGWQKGAQAVGTIIGHLCNLPPSGQQSTATCRPGLTEVLVVPVAL